MKHLNCHYSSLPNCISNKEKSIEVKSMDDGVEGVVRVQFFKTDLKNLDEVLSKLYSQYIFGMGDSEVQEKEATRMQNGALTQACCSEEITL